MIDKIGVELEGIFSPDVYTYADGSLSFYSSELSTYGRNTGEVSFCCYADELLSALKRNYPIYANDTCGLHVHLSFTAPKDYFFLTRNAPTIYKSLVKIAAKHFPQRLDNQYCNSIDFGLQDLRRRRTRRLINEVSLYQYEADSKNNSRYNILNFCYNLHGTVEMRLFPVFENYFIAHRMIIKYLKIINKIIKDERVMKLCA